VPPSGRTAAVNDRGLNDDGTIAREGTLDLVPAAGWTSDLDRSAELFGRYYPERIAQMRIAAATGRNPSADPAILGLLIDDLGPWLAAEYTAVHGEKAPRPNPG
jgi:uncharacterized protein